MLQASSVARWPRQLDVLHERRHLLVHRLGRVDKRYRGAYGTGEKRLNVGRRYIAQSLARLREFVDYVDAETEERLRADAPEPLRDSGPSTLRVALTLLTPDARQRVLSHHTLIVGDEFVDFPDLITSATSDDAGDMVLELGGRRAHLNAALKLIKQLKRAGYCEIRSVKLSRPARARARGVPHALLLRIAHEIHEGPIPANRRDEIAQRFDIKLAQASRTIRSINAMPSDGTMRVLRSLAPDGQWPADLHRMIAAALAIDPRVASQGLRQIAWERRRTDGSADGHAAGNAVGA